MEPLQGQTGKSRSRIREMFGAIAPTYDLLNHLLSLSVDRWWRWTTVRLALESLDGDVPSQGTRPALRVLDVATGTGDLALAFADRLGPGARVVAVDFAAPMLDFARDKSRRRGIEDRLVLAEADGHALPFPDEAFDLATIAFGLRNTEDPEAVLRQMGRVVRPGGCVAVLEFVRPPNSLFRRVFEFYFHRILPRIGGWVSRSNAYRYLPSSVKTFWTMKEFRHHLGRGGLRVAGSWWLSGGIAALHIARREKS